MGVEYALVTFERQDDGSIASAFVKGIQKYGKILVESTEETRTPLGILSFADDSETVTVRMSVRRVGTQDLNEKEKNFPLEEVEFSYSTDGVQYQKAGSYKAVPGRWVGVKSGVFCAAQTLDAGSCMVRKCVYA